MRNKEKKNWNILTYMYIRSKKNKLFKNLRIYKNMELKFKENNWDGYVKRNDNVSIIFKCKEKKREMYISCSGYLQSKRKNLLI